MDEADYLPEREAILLLNAGTTSLKSAVFEAGPALPGQRPVWRGSVTGIGRANCCWRDSEGARAILPPDPDPFLGAFSYLLARALAWLGDQPVRAVGYRLPMAAGQCGAAGLLDEPTLAALEAMTGPVPRYQRDTLRMARKVAALWPGVPQVASFDTWFHRTLPLAERMLPLPYRYWEAGLRRTGCHGISYDYIAMMLRRRFGSRAGGRVIVAHLGSTASLCGMLRLRSVAASSGLTPMDGLMTGTGAGALPPTALRYLMREVSGPDELDRLLDEQSGLLGVSGESAEVDVLLRREAETGPVAERANVALTMFVRQVVREIGAIAALLGGLDILVFTGGLGEHGAVLRQRVCDALQWLGVRLDRRRNARGARSISLPGSAVTVAVESTCEEWTMARDCLMLTNAAFGDARATGGAPPAREESA